MGKSSKTSIQSETDAGAERLTVEDFDYALGVVRRLVADRSATCCAIKRRITGQSTRPGVKQWARQEMSDIDLVYRVLKYAVERLTYL